METSKLCLSNIWIIQNWEWLIISVKKNYNSKSLAHLAEINTQSQKRKEEDRIGKKTEQVK